MDIATKADGITGLGPGLHQAGMASALHAPMTYVLVVEDDAVIRQVLNEFLGDSGYEVHCVQNGNEALAAMARRRPDVVVLDLMLPIMDGWRLVETLHTQTKWSAVPIIAISAVHDLAAHAARLGVRACMPKPIDLEGLASHIEHLAHGGPARTVSG